LNQKLSSALEVLGTILIVGAIYISYGIAAAGFTAGIASIVFGIALAGPLRRRPQ